MNGLFSPTDTLVCKCYNQSPCMFVNETTSLQMESVLDPLTSCRGYELCLKLSDGVKYTDNKGIFADIPKDKSYTYIFGRLTMTVNQVTDKKTHNIELFYLLDVAAREKSLYTSPMFIEYFILHLFSDKGNIKYQQPKQQEVSDNTVYIKDLKWFDLINVTAYFKIPEFIRIDGKCVFARDIHPSILFEIYRQFISNVSILVSFNSISKSSSQIGNMINTKIFNYRKADLRQKLNAVFQPFDFYRYEFYESSGDVDVTLIYTIMDNMRKTSNIQLVFREEFMLNELPKRIRCRIETELTGISISEDKIEELWKADEFLLEKPEDTENNQTTYKVNLSKLYKNKPKRPQVDIQLYMLKDDNKDIYLCSKYSDYIHLTIINPDAIYEMKDKITYVDKLPALVYDKSHTKNDLTGITSTSVSPNVEYNGNHKKKVSDSEPKLKPELKPFELKSISELKVNKLKNMAAISTLLMIQSELMCSTQTYAFKMGEVYKFLSDTVEILEPPFDYRIDQSKDGDTLSLCCLKTYGKEAIGELTDFYHIIVVNNAVYVEADTFSEDVRMILQILKQPNTHSNQCTFMKSEYVPSTDGVSIQSISMNDVRLSKPICVTRIMLETDSTLESYLTEALCFFTYDFTVEDKERIFNILKNSNSFKDLTVMDLRKLLFINQSAEIFCNLYTLLYMKICKINMENMVQIGEITNEYFRDIRSDLYSFDLLETKFGFMLNHELDLYRNSRIQILSTGTQIYTRPAYMNPLYLWIEAKVIADDGDMCLLRDLKNTMGVDLSTISEDNVYWKYESELGNGNLSLDGFESDISCFTKNAKEDVIGIIHKLQNWFKEMSDILINSEDCYSLYTVIKELIEMELSNDNDVSISYQPDRLNTDLKLESAVF